ncbi:MAG: hypothetical protein ACFFDI_04220 [Promethearchaeota archaeon]
MSKDATEMCPSSASQETSVHSPEPKWTGAGVQILHPLEIRHAVSDLSIKCGTVERKILEF